MSRIGDYIANAMRRRDELLRSPASDDMTEDDRRAIADAEFGRAFAFSIEPSPAARAKLDALLPVDVPAPAEEKLPSAAAYIASLSTLGPQPTAAEHRIAVDLAQTLTENAAADNEFAILAWCYLSLRHEVERLRSAPGGST